MYNVGCGKQVGGLSSSLAEGDGFPRPTLATNVVAPSDMPISKHQKVATNMVVQAFEGSTPRQKVINNERQTRSSACGKLVVDGTTLLMATNVFNNVKNN
jgi:hypothetical protein